MNNMLEKLITLLKGLSYTYDLGKYDDEKLRKDIYELVRIISEARKEKLTEKDWKWCNKTSTKYEIDKIDKNIDWDNISRVDILLEGMGINKIECINKIKYICFFGKDRKKDGLETTWNIDGQKIEEVTYKDGKLDGLSVAWYEYGQMSFEINYKDGEFDGLYTEWYENGKKKEEGTWKDGKRDGLQTTWYENGKKKVEENYKDDKQDGFSTEWYESGKKKGEGTFKDGELVNLIGMWNKDGSVRE